MVHPTAIVHPDAIIGEDSEIGPYCVIGEHVRIGPRAMLSAHVVISGHTTIGEDARIYPFASIGTASQDKKYEGEIAYTAIGNRVTIREYVSIHSATGAGETTSIGDDCLLLGYVHIAHNCRIGNGVTMSNLCQLAGHVVVEDHANLGGMAGAHQFVRIGAYSMVGGGSKLRRDVPPYFLVEGEPARPFGLNKVGLKRAEFSSKTLAEMKECYKLLYNSGHNVTQAVAAMREIVTTDECRYLITFLEEKSERGIVK
jgi:UDP-N-acetylglucosamine acyltransferase